MSSPNEATGRYFLANGPTVALLDAINRTGNLPAALRQTGISADHAKAVIDHLIGYGVVVQRGVTQQSAAPKAPLESKMIALRFDLVDAARVTQRVAWLGRIAFSRFGLVIWLCLVIAMLYFLITNGEKARFALGQVMQAGWADIARFAVLFVGLKVVHEMGHAMAYRIMCEREGHDPGPIRMGISIFALTPFPFTDVTGAWRLKSRWRRAAIGAGGIYFEIGITALLTIFWALTSSGPFQVAIFQVAIFTAMTTIIFNLNPAIKLDGYYVLSDLTGQHNIASRGTTAARDWLTRRLGGQADRPDRLYLFYWLFSYAYRWTLFASIFWIFYRLDDRLAGPIALVILMTLVGRPLMASLKYAMKKGAGRMNLLIAGSFAGAAVVVCLIPFPDRLLLDGRTVLYDTRPIYPAEAAQVDVTPSGGDGPQIVLRNPELDYLNNDLSLRQAILQNAVRAVSGSAPEQARLRTNAASLDLLAFELDEREKRLQIVAGADEVWDIRAAEQFDGAWVQARSSNALGFLSEPAPLKVLLWLDQGTVEQGVLEQSELPLQIRLAPDPSCGFAASVAGPLSNVAAQNGVFALTAFPRGETPDCLAQFQISAPVVARLGTTPKSVFDRVWRTLSRLLQNRLPGEELNQNF